MYVLGNSRHFWLESEGLTYLPVSLSYVQLMCTQQRGETRVAEDVDDEREGYGSECDDACDLVASCWPATYETVCCCAVDDNDND